MITPAKRGRGNTRYLDKDRDDQTPAERRASITLAQRLKRVFNIDVEICRECNGTVRIIACIEDPVVIKIITHLQEKTTVAEMGLLLEGRAPLTGMFG